MQVKIIQQYYSRLFSSIRTKEQHYAKHRTAQPWNTNNTS